MDLTKIEVGKVLNTQLPDKDQCVMNMDSSGLSLLINFDNPTTNEIEQMKAEQPFEIRFVALNDIIYFTIKFGTLQWIDAPYSPHLSNLGAAWEEITDDRLGYSLTIILTDARTRIVKNIRFVGLGNTFSKKLYESVKFVSSQTFDIINYDKALRAITYKYTSAQLANMAVHSNRYKT